jgi:hypothetical protein
MLLIINNNHARLTIRWGCFCGNIRDLLSYAGWRPRFMKDTMGIKAGYVQLLVIAGFVNLIWPLLMV